MMSLAGPLVIRTFDMGKGQAAKDRELARHSPLLSVLGTDGDSPREWLAAGQAMQRVVLLACSHGLTCSYLNQPVEVEDIRPRLADAVGRSGGEHPQLFLRFGYDRRSAPRRARRWKRSSSIPIRSATPLTAKMADPPKGPSITAASEVKLPQLVRGYLEHVLPRGHVLPRQVRITQKGQMRQKPGGRAMRFTAVQHFAVERIAFSWQARFPVVGPLALRIVDDYADGEGKLEGRMLGVPVLRQAGPEAASAQALRYLAELPWVPQAMAHNGELEWRELDERSGEAAAHVGGERLAVKLEFDDTGDIVRASSPMRPYRVAKKLVPTPWGGNFAEHNVLGGMRIPTSAEVYWDLADGRFVYWRGTVTALELLDLPFQRSQR